MAGFAVTKDIQRARQIVKTTDDVPAEKRLANRRHRRARHRHERALLRDVDAEVRAPRLMTGWDVA